MPNLEGRKAINVWMGEESQQNVLHTMRSTLVEDVSSAVELLIERGSLPVELEADVKDYMYLNNIKSFSVAIGSHQKRSTCRL